VPFGFCAEGIEYVGTMYKKLKRFGTITVKTDVFMTITLTMKCLADHGGFRVEQVSSDSLGLLEKTYREKRCIRKGLDIYALKATKT